jgi:hypothetical protein
MIRPEPRGVGGRFLITIGPLQLETRNVSNHVKTAALFDMEMIKLAYSYTPFVVVTIKTAYTL